MPVADDIRAILLAYFQFPRDLPEDYECPPQAEGQSREVYEQCIEDLKLFWCLQNINVGRLKHLRAKFKDVLYPILTCSKYIIEILIGTVIFNGRSAVHDDGINASITCEDLDWLFAQPASFFATLLANRKSFKAAWLGESKEKLLKVGRYYYALTMEVDLFLVPVEFPYHNPYYNRADESTLAMAAQSSRLLDINNAVFRDPIFYFKLKLMMDIEEHMKPSIVGISTSARGKTSLENFAALNPEGSFNNLQDRVMMIAAHRPPMGWYAANLFCCYFY